jgi:thiamine phosphate synthase YjbQ (UPF0047 family)
MKTHRKELWFEVPQRRQFINITGQVEEALRESGIREGLSLVNTLHQSFVSGRGESGTVHVDSITVPFETAAAERTGLMSAYSP